MAEATAGGIYIPDNAKERHTQGQVVAAGPGRIHPETGLLIEIAVNVGESVLYGKYDGTELKYNGKEATLENVEPVKDQVLVELPAKEATSMGGIIVSTPDEKKKRPDYGKVVKVGPGRIAGNGVLMKPQVAPGDSVRLRDFGGSEIKLDGKEYLVVRAYDILAKW